MDDTIKIDSVTELARNWGRFDNYRVTHGRRDGTQQTVNREVYDHGSAAAVLMHAPSAGTVLLTRQFRLPPAPQWRSGLADRGPGRLA